jgi:hypothetical protein
MAAREEGRKPMPMTEKLRDGLARHWFVAMLPVLAFAGWMLVRAAPAADATMVGRVLLVDVCVSVPLLYALCYGRRQPLRKTLIRCLALAAIGVSLLGWTLPVEYRAVSARYSWLFLAAEFGVALVEIGVVIAVVRLAFSAAPKPEALTDKGVPPLIARLMLIEARFWKAVWRLIRRR